MRAKTSWSLTAWGRPDEVGELPSVACRSTAAGLIPGGARIGNVCCLRPREHHYSRGLRLPKQSEVLAFRNPGPCMEDKIARRLPAKRVLVVSKSLLSETSSKMCSVVAGAGFEPA